MLETLFQNSSQQVLTKYNPQIREINEIGKRLKKFTDLELQETATELKTKLQSGTSKELVINEAFALVREASDRILGLRHFDVQLVGGLALTEGKIAEMKTGGKNTCSFTPNLFLCLIR